MPADGASTPLKLVPRCVERGRGEEKRSRGEEVDREGNQGARRRRGREREREGEISGRERPLGNITKHPANRVSSSLCLLLYFTSFLIPPNSTVQEPGRRHEKPGGDRVPPSLPFLTLDPSVNRATKPRSRVYWLLSH